MRQWCCLLYCSTAMVAFSGVGKSPALAEAPLSDPAYVQDLMTKFPAINVKKIHPKYQRLALAPIFPEQNASRFDPHFKGLPQAEVTVAQAAAIAQKAPMVIALHPKPKPVISQIIPPHPVTMQPKKMVVESETSRLASHFSPDASSQADTVTASPPPIATTIPAAPVMHESVQSPLFSSGSLYPARARRYDAPVASDQSAAKADTPTETLALTEVSPQHTMPAAEAIAPAEAEPLQKVETAIVAAVKENRKVLPATALVAPADAPKFDAFSTIEMQKDHPVEQAALPIPSPRPDNNADRLMPLPEVSEPKKAHIIEQQQTSSEVSLSVEPVSHANSSKAIEDELTGETLLLAEAKPLSPETQKILSRIPRGIDSPKRSAGKAEVSRFDPEIEGILNAPAGEDGEESEQSDAFGFSMEVRKPAENIERLLEYAYEALVAEDFDAATEAYKDILRAAPTNQDALFGLASTFHRIGQIELARPFYGKLLALNPSHREGLNNFLVLVADESPEEAIEQLHRLEKANPDFSPIPAQLGLLYDRLGAFEQAKRYMMRAAKQSPDNFTYLYNLAVLLDRHKYYDDAASLYNRLLQASDAGASIPADASTIKERMIYINNLENRS